MILSFKKKFPWGTETNFHRKIVFDKTKIHSIREDKSGRWKTGRLIHMAHGVRTKFYHCFYKDYCVSIQKIKITHFDVRKYKNTSSVRIWIDEKLFYDVSQDIEKLAKNDGFDSVEDFFKWFDEDFKGKIIHWTDFRY